MKANLMTLVITLTVGIILTGSLLAPVISDATETERTFQNVGIYVNEDPDETYEIVWDGTTLEINGGTVTLPESGQTPIIVLDGFSMLYKNNANMVCTAVAYESITSATFTAEAGAFSGSYVINGATKTVSTTYTDIQVLSSEKTDYSYFNAPKYVKTGDKITMNGVQSFNDSAGSSHPLRWSFEGTVGGECQAVTISGVASQYVFSNAKINYTAVEGFDDLYSIESISFDVAYTHPSTPGVTAAFTITNLNMIGPSEATAELTNHLDVSQIAILGAIPVLIIVALVLGAVKFVAPRD